MSNINLTASNSDVFSVNDEQLFAELTSVEGANISGGTTDYYYIGNNTDINVNFYIEGDLKNLRSGRETRYSYDKKPKVTYDSLIGRGVKWVTTNLNSEQSYYFDRNGKNLFLIADGNSDPGTNLQAEG
jgi:hypothetical protein